MQMKSHKTFEVPVLFTTSEKWKYFQKTNIDETKLQDTQLSHISWNNIWSNDTRDRTIDNFKPIDVDQPLTTSLKAAYDQAR